MSEETLVPTSAPGRHWLICVLGAFSIAGALFFLPWESLLHAPLGTKEIAWLIFETLSSSVFLPLAWLASVAGYVAVGLLGIALFWVFVTHIEKKSWWAINLIAFTYAVLGLGYSMIGQYVQFNERALNFLSGSAPTGVFEVIDKLDEHQVAALRAGMLADVDSGLLFETVTGTTGKSAGYKRTFFYRIGLKEKMDPSFLGMFRGGEEDMQLGPVCERVRKNYLQSKTLDRYQLSINGKVVTPDAGSCKALGINKVGLSYRGAFSAP